MHPAAPASVISQQRQQQRLEQDVWPQPSPSKTRCHLNQLADAVSAASAQQDTSGSGSGSRLTSPHHRIHQRHQRQDSSGFDTCHASVNSHRGTMSPAPQDNQQGGFVSTAMSAMGFASEDNTGANTDYEASQGRAGAVGRARGGPSRQNSRGRGMTHKKQLSYSDRETSLMSTQTSRGGEHDADLAGEYTLDEAADEDVYFVKQRRGYCAIGFSVVQTIVLGLMMWQCGIAPLNVNPMIGPYPDALNYWGAKNSVLIIDDGEAWRLLTPIFLHAGIIHLLCNAGVQLETGAFFEREWGSPIWLLVYLTSAIGSSCLSAIFMPGSISVGSSGSVCGLFGAKLAEVFCRSCEARRTQQERIGHEVRMEQLSAIMCSVVLIGLFSFIPYVDWAAHLGGFMAGLVVGLMVFAFSIGNRCWVGIWFAVGAVLTIIFYTVSLQHMYNEVDPPEEMRDVCEYYKQYFPDYECNCQLDNKD